MALLLDYFIYILTLSYKKEWNAFKRFLKYISLHFSGLQSNIAKNRVLMPIYKPYDKH